MGDDSVDGQYIVTFILNCLLPPGARLSLSAMLETALKGELTSILPVS